MHATRVNCITVVSLEVVEVGVGTDIYIYVMEALLC